MNTSIGMQFVRHHPYRTRPRARQYQVNKSIKKDLFKNKTKKSFYQKKKKTKQKKYHHATSISHNIQSLFM